MSDKQIKDRDKQEVAVVVGGVAGARISRDLFEKIIAKRIKHGVVAIGEGAYSRANYVKSALAHEMLPADLTGADLLNMPDNEAIALLGGTEEVRNIYMNTKTMMNTDFAGDDMFRRQAEQEINGLYSQRIEKYLQSTNKEYARQVEAWQGLAPGKSLPKEVEMREMNNPFMTMEERTNLVQQGVQRVEEERQIARGTQGEVKVSEIDDAINGLIQRGMTREEAIQEIERQGGGDTDIKATLEEQGNPDLTNNEGIELTEMSPEIKTATDLQTAQQQAFSRIAEAEGINLGVPKVREFAGEDDILRNIMIDQIGRDKKVAQLFGQKGFSNQTKKLLGDLGHITNIGLVGWSVVSLSEDLATGKKLTGYDIANYVNNIGAGATYSVLSLGGSALASSFGWASMGVGGLLAIGEVTANNFERDKQEWRTADKILNDVGSSATRIQSLVNHKNEMKHTIALMNNYGNLYYKYILNQEGGYATQEQFNFKPKHQKYTLNSSYDRFNREGLLPDIVNLLAPDGGAQKQKLDELLRREFENFDSYGRPQKEIRDYTQANKIVDFLNAHEENVAQQAYIKKTYGYTDNNIHNLVRYARNTILETTDSNLQKHFENQVKLTRGYSDKLNHYKENYNQLIRKAMDTNYNKEVAIGMKQKRPQSFFDNLKESHEAMINNPKFFLSDQDAENGTPYMKLNRIKKMVSVPPPSLPFWCYMYHANADLYRLQDYKLINDKIKKSKSKDKPIPIPPFNPKPPKPKPDDPPKPEPDDPKPDEPDKPKPKPKPKPFDPPVTPDKPDVPPEPMPVNPPYQPFPHGRDTKNPMFEPIGETSYDDIDIEFNAELALYLLRSVEKAYQPRTEIVRVFDEL